MRATCMYMTRCTDLVLECPKAVYTKFENVQIDYSYAQKAMRVVLKLCTKRSSEELAEIFCRNVCSA